MKYLRIEITEEELEGLKEKAKCYETSPRKLVEQFVSDLTWSERSGGSDERGYADDWYSRSRYNF